MKAQWPTACRRSVRSPRCISAWALAVVLSASSVALAQQQSTGGTGLGRAPTKAELARLDISIGPEGAELPPGSGTASQGALVFTQRGCSDCHGPTGKEGPGPVLIGGKVTIGTHYFPISYFPYAPIIWDFINRAMPLDRPGRLTANETYALTAFLLHRNGIIEEDDVMDVTSLPKVRMPHRSEYRVPAPWKPGTPRGFRIVP